MNTRKKISRRTFLTAGLGLAAASGLGYMRFFEPGRYERTERRAAIGKLKSPLRVLHLSDFHASNVVSYGEIESAISASLTLKPDIAFLTGDFITWDLTEEDRYRSILATLSATVQTFACLGNHDGGQWAGSSRGYRHPSASYACCAPAA